MTPSVSMAAASLGVAAEPKPSKADDAARQFEGLLIAQMLRSARESGELGDDETDSESSTMFDVAGQQFAQLLAQQGGIGLARLVAHGLTQNRNSTQDTPTPGKIPGPPHPLGGTASAPAPQKGH